MNGDMQYAGDGIVIN